MGDSVIKKVEIKAECFATFGYTVRGFRYKVKAYYDIDEIMYTDHIYNKDNIWSFVDRIVLDRAENIISYGKIVEGLRSPREDEELLSIELRNVLIEQTVSSKECVNQNEDGTYFEEVEDTEGDLVYCQYPAHMKNKARYEYVKDRDSYIRLCLEHRDYHNIGYDYADDLDELNDLITDEELELKDL